jgi:hypothetical protein
MDLPIKMRKIFSKSNFDKKCETNKLAQSSGKEAVK